jgi:hypothetical protein
MIKNLLAAVGLLTLAAAIVAGAWLYVSFGNFDPKAAEVYLDIAQRLVKTGSPVEATVWKTRVNDGLTAEDVELTMKSVAVEHNIKDVGELPLSDQVAAMTGELYRTVKIYMFCSALTAARMLDYSDAFAAYLPCRVALVEDPRGALWLYTLNMDLVVHGGRPLPPALKEEAMGVKATIRDIMARGARGAF